MSDIEFEMLFNDLTILEANGSFKEVAKIMLDEGGPSDWMLASKLTMNHELGSAEFSLHFWNNKNIYIADYEPSVKDVFYNSDLRCLVYWAQQNGWNMPRVSDDLVKDNIEYWKFFWGVNLIDSGYLDNIFKDRSKVSLDYSTGDSTEDDEEDKK